MQPGAQEIWDLIKRLSPAGAVRQTLWKLWNGGRVHPALGANPLQKGLPPEQYLREGVGFHDLWPQIAPNSQGRDAA